MVYNASSVLLRLRVPRSCFSPHFLHFSRSLNARCDHATDFISGYSLRNPQNVMRQGMAFHAFRTSDLACSLHSPFRISNNHHHLADILVLLAAPPSGKPPDKPNLYYVTLCNPFTCNVLRQTVRGHAGAAEAVTPAKRHALNCTPLVAIHLTDDAPIVALAWDFTPVLFDALVPAPLTLRPLL